MADNMKFVDGAYVQMTEAEIAQRAADEAEWLATKDKVYTVSPYQARVALLNAGLLATVETLMADPGTPGAAKIAWEYATVIQRNSPFIATLGPALGLTEEQIDALFTAAAQIT